ncbi:cytochrome P450 [Nocardia seriolae]|uniref:cytochrome P450 n=1 Tax=Nocardia seriolae TaxID=37332 RepID=UPI00118ED9E4|nr:cytochrome P450 [Nocardia seriolae]GEM26962.1 cytochrome P450 [Nocardia seriolae NBRC 15557]
MPAVPHPPWRVPLVGDALSLSARTPAQSITEHAAELGEVFEVRVLRYPRMLIVNSAKLAEPILDDRHWTKVNGPAFRRLAPMAPTGLLFTETEDAVWKLAHDRLQPAFSRTAMRAYHAAMNPVIAEHLRRWRDLPQPVNISDLTQDLAYDVITRAGFGARLDREQRAEFVDTMFALIRTTNRGKVIPFLDAVVGINPVPPHAGSLRRHVEMVVDSGTADAPLSAALADTDPERGAPLTRSQIIDQAVVMLIAGHETTAGTVAFALYELSRHPGIADRARAEIAETGRHPSELDYEDIAGLRYLRAVVDETLRLHPVAPAFIRGARTTTAIADHRVTPDDWIYLNLLAIHRDPAVWTDPGRFSPDRFLTGPAPLTYKPFGAGARACIGRALALHEAVLTLAHVLHDTDLGQTGYRLDIAEFPTLKPRGLTLRLG